MKNISKLLMVLIVGSALVGTDAHGMNFVRTAMHKAKTLAMSRFAQRTAGAVVLGTAAVVPGDQTAQQQKAGIIPGASYAKLHGKKDCQQSIVQSWNVAWRDSSKPYETRLNFGLTNVSLPADLVSNHTVSCTDHTQEYEQYQQRYQKTGVAAAYDRWKAGMALKDAFSTDRLSRYHLYVASFYNVQGQSIKAIPQLIRGAKGETSEDVKDFALRRKGFADLALNKIDPNVRPEAAKGVISDCLKRGRSLDIVDKNGRHVFNMQHFRGPDDVPALAEVAKYVDISKMSIEDRTTKRKWFGLF